MRRRSFESSSRSRSMDMSKDPEGVNGYADKPPKSFKQHISDAERLKELIDSLPRDDDDTLTSRHEQAVNDAREAVLNSYNKLSGLTASQTDTRPSTSQKYNPDTTPSEEFREVLRKYYDIWEDEKENADKRGVNPSTGLYEKGLTPIDESDRVTYETRKILAEKQASGAQLTMEEIMQAGRDGVLYEWNGQKLKPDHCYRKIQQPDLDHYRESGFVDNNIDLKTLERKDGRKVKGRIDTVDWYLGATTSRYGDILIEAPANPDYFVPVETPGKQGNMLTDPDAIHMHSSGIVDPIPMSEVRVLGREESKDSAPDPELESSSVNSEKAAFKGEYENIIQFEGRENVNTLKEIYSKLSSARPEQVDRFNFLYKELSAVSKITPSSPEEEQQKLTQLFDIRDKIDKLKGDLG